MTVGPQVSDATTCFRSIREVELDSAPIEVMRRRTDTANNHLMARKCTLDHAQLNGLVDSSISWHGVRHLDRVGRYRPLVLDPGQVEALIGRLKPPVRHLAEAVWHTRARIGEIPGLRRDRVLAGHGFNSTSYDLKHPVVLILNQVAQSCRKIARLQHPQVVCSFVASLLRRTDFGITMTTETPLIHVPLGSNFHPNFGQKL